VLEHHVALADVLVHVQARSFLSFSIELPGGAGCGVCAKTSTTAVERRCLYATNAGFFDLGSCACEGSIVSNGGAVQVCELLDEDVPGMIYMY
jgi:hypothetical protein